MDTCTLQPGQVFKKELYDRDVEFNIQTKNYLKVLTYNIWDRPDYWQERVEHVVRLVKENSPDVGCLLDVSENCYNFILKELERLYIIFQVFLSEGESSGIVLLCRRETVDLPPDTQPYYYDFTSGKGRIIGVELIVQSTGEKVNVLCTKLDDYRDNDHIRADQFAVVQQVIKGLKKCIVLGDYNIFRENEEVLKKIHESKLYDAWSKMGCPTRVKYSFDGKHNRITQDKSQIRAARVYYRGDYKIKSIGFIGTSQISNSLRITASCHYGLIAVFQLKK